MEDLMTPKLFAPLAVVLLGASLPVAAHSLKDVEKSLHEQERYVQFVDRAAPGFSLTDPDGNVVTLADFRGKAVVLNFVYTRCTEACPLHMNTIKQLQDRVNTEGLRDQAQFVTIATDTEDVPSTRENMRAYRTNFQFDPTNWRFLFRSEGEPQDHTRELAEKYGLTFSVTEDGEQIHGVVTHVIDQTGQMRARFHGLKFKHEHFVKYVTAVARGPDAVAPTGFWERLNSSFEGLFNRE
jgi:protein SCO1/2